MSATATIHVGDCVEVMRSMEAETFSAVVTDPPYALEFMGKGWDRVLPGGEVWAECLRLLKPGGLLLAFGGTRTFHRLTCAIEDAGLEVRDCLSWLYGSGFPKSLDVSKAIDKEAGAEREVVGERVTGAAMSHKPSGEDLGTGGTAFGSGQNTVDITAPATDAARAWSGYGTALKPAWEPIVLAMKPLDGTYARNAQKHGVAGLNVDGGRIGTEGGTRGSNYAGTGLIGIGGKCDIEQLDAGRFPANLVLDEEAAAMLDEQSGESKSTQGKSSGGFSDRSAIYGSGRHVDRITGANDSGGASRFFYTAKAASAERHAEGEVRNTHPTVKPLDLMQYLVRLVRMPEGTRILDPFAGSGSTLIAALREGVEVVGIEQEAEYVEIARQRVVADAPLFNRCDVNPGP